MEALFDVPVWYILSKKYVFFQSNLHLRRSEAVGGYAPDRVPKAPSWVRPTDAPDRVTLGILSQREPRAFQG